MKLLILLVSTAVLAGGIAFLLYFLLRSKWGKNREFDATRDLFI